MLEAAAGVDQGLMVVAGVVSATTAALGLTSCPVCAGEAGGDAACAGPAGETSKEDSMPWAVEEQRMGAGCKVIAEEQAQRRMVCSTWIGASGWVAGRRLAYRADRAVVIEQMQES